MNLISQTSNLFIYLLSVLMLLNNCSNGFTFKEIQKYRDDVQAMFYHAYDGYITYAYPYDELRPLTCDGHDTWGSYSLTLIDALDTLAVMGNASEFGRVVNLITKRSNFNVDINVSVFETNIRIVGGLLSAHLMAKRMGLDVGVKWPCDGPLLNLAEDVANRLLPAFDTPTGMPYGTVNLRDGVPIGETPVTCTAGVGTFLVEFGTLSRLTNNPVYEDVAIRAVYAVWQNRSPIDLLGNHIDVLSGRWTAQDSGIGAGVDSYFEYLVKGAILFKRPELMTIFMKSRTAIQKYLRHDDWHLWATMGKGHVTMAVFQSLEAYWPGVLALVGDVEAAQKSLFNYHQVWKQFGFTPEFYNIPQAEAAPVREGYPLRPELAESLVYLFRATQDHTFLEMGADIITSIKYSTKTPCGYATVKNVNDHSLENQMESFFLAETTKYLYLLFDPDHWLHNTGNKGTLHHVDQRSCVIHSGGYIFNTEAHPIDPGALHCCSGPEVKELFEEKELVSLIINPTAHYSLYEGDLFYSHSVLKKTKPRYNEHSNSIDNHKNQNNVINLDENKNKNVQLGQDKQNSDSDINTDDDVKYSDRSDGNIEEISAEPNSGANENVEPVILNENENGVHEKIEASVRFDNIEALLLSEFPKESSKTASGELDDTSAGELKMKENLKTVNEASPRFSSMSEVDQQNLGSNQSMMEQSNISPSVSSSKYNLNMALAASRMAMINEVQTTPLKPSRNKVFTMAGLKDRLVSDSSAFSNFSKTTSFTVLSCPHPAFTNMLNFKGQMFNP